MWADKKEAGTFEELLGSLGLKDFEPYEFLISTNRWPNTLPPREIWGNLPPTLAILGAVREHYHRPIIVTCCYRNEAYNARTKGSGSRSQHTALTAVDFVVKGVYAPDVAELLVSWRGRPFPLLADPAVWPRVPVVLKAGAVPYKPLALTDDGGFIFAGGVGFYPTFTHLDTRGINATWRARGV